MPICGGGGAAPAGSAPPPPSVSPDPAAGAPAADAAEPTAPPAAPTPEDAGRAALRQAYRRYIDYTVPATVAPEPGSFIIIPAGTASKKNARKRKRDAEVATDPAAAPALPPGHMADIPTMGYVKTFECKNFFEKSYPHLFCYGRGGLHDADRFSDISETRWDEYLMTEASQRFASNIQFLFARYRFRNRKSAGSLAFVAGKNRKEQPAVPLNAGNLRAAADYAAAGSCRSQHEAEMESLLRIVRTFGSSLKTTYMHIAAERRKLLATLASPVMTAPVRCCLAPQASTTPSRSTPCVPATVTVCRLGFLLYPRLVRALLLADIFNGSTTTSTSSIFSSPCRPLLARALHRPQRCSRQQPIIRGRRQAAV